MAAHAATVQHGYVQWLNSPTRYGAIGQSLHWLVVAGLVALYLTAEAGEGDAAMSWHRSLGIAVLGLAVVRVVWRLLERPPRAAGVMPPWQRSAARTAHLIFYALLFALPLTGWLLSGAEGDPVIVFGRLTLPSLPAAVDPDTVEEVHEALFNVLVGVAALHAAAALKHHFWDRDGVLKSMLPGRDRPG